MSRLLRTAAVGLVVGIVGMGLVPLTLDLEEGLGLGLLFHMRGTRQAPSDVVIVTLDRISADRLNLPADPEKWPRSLHARLLEKLEEGGAAVIAFDMLFEEAHSTEADHLFAEAIFRANNVVLCESLKKTTAPLTGTDGTRAGNVRIESISSPLPLFANSAIALAPFPLPKIPVRVSQYWTFKIGAGDLPTLPVVAFQVFALNAYDEFIRLLKTVKPGRADQLPGGKEAVISNKSVTKLIRDLRVIFETEPLTMEKMLQALENETTLSENAKKQQTLRSLLSMYKGGHSRYLNFYGPPGTIPTVSYFRVVQPDESRKPIDLNGKAVFVGLSERLRPEQRDGFNTVFSQSSGADISGVEIAATAFANFLEDMPVEPLSPPVHFGVILLWGVALGLVCYLLSPVLAAPAVLGICVVYLLAALYQFEHAGNWYPLMVPFMFQVPLAYFGSVLWKYAETNRERKNIRQAFGYYLPNKVVDHLAKDMAALKTDSQIVYGTCLCTDAAQYTSLSETMDPRALASYLNDYFEAVFEPVKEHGGRVSDVVGDSMLAIWAKPDPDDDLIKKACLSALDIATAVRHFNASYERLQLPTRIGLHAGPMSLGNIGASDHYEYRPVGDVVNTASRIEGLNKYLGTEILVSKEVVLRVGGFLSRELGVFLLLGKSKPVAIYELMVRMEESNEAQRNLCTLFAEGMAAYRKQSWGEAIKTFQECIRVSAGDGPSRLYVGECEKHRANPPGESWSGLVYAAGK